MTMLQTLRELSKDRMTVKSLGPDFIFMDLYEINTTIVPKRVVYQKGASTIVDVIWKDMNSDS